MMARELDDLTDEEKKLIEKIPEGSYEEIKSLVTEEKIRINCFDDHGMTPLQHAAYRGNYDLCKLLLDCGADVNSDHHDNGYTTLMFAALSGKLNVVSLLLEHGASTTAVNSVNRTASQMAAFVGNHDAVSIINNFIPIEEIDYYTEVRGLETEPKLPPTLGKLLHQFVIKTNIHPVRLVMFLQSNMPLLEDAKKVIRVLDHLAARQLKDNGNELSSLKLHHLSFIVKACDQFLCEQNLKAEASAILQPKGVSLDPLIKRWIRGGNEEGFPVLLERLLRQSIREYPFVDCSLFQQLVRTLAPVEVGTEPSAISILSQAVSGQRGIEDSLTCSTCGEPRAVKKCSICKSVQYCDKICQKFHWFTHKTICPNLAEKYKEESKDNALESEKVKENISSDQ